MRPCQRAEAFERWLTNKKSKKALYKHKRTGDLFAIETDETGRVLSTSGPLLLKDLNPNELDYDNYWDEDIKAHLHEFVLLSKAEYEELLKRTGFFIQETQRSIFDETNCTKERDKPKKGNTGID
jgi:hypothetical protein